MNTKYAVFNPSTGENTLYDTKELAIEAFWDLAIDVARTYFHNTVYSTVVQNDDGSEVWSNDIGEIVEKPLTPEERQAKTLNLIGKKMLEASKITPVEVLP